MEPRNAQDSEPSLSVVIPSFNSAEWLPSTLDALAVSLARTSWKAEVIVVDDGSTDSTDEMLNSFSGNFPYKLRVVSQENKGRFLARWAGVQAARSEHLLILDSRVLLHERGLEYLQKDTVKRLGIQAWNGHITIDSSSALVGRFWEVPTFLFWGDYLRDPRPMLITLENYDRVPKGTGCFFVSKELFEKACVASWPVENAQLASDDTKILRFIAGESPIRLDPGFSATYRPRSTLSGFLAHSWNRGTLFVDSYAGTSSARNVILVALVVLPPALAALLVVLAYHSIWGGFWITLGVILGSLLLPVIFAAGKRCPTRALVSFATFIVPFGVTFWAGLSRGLIVHRGSFFQHSHVVEKRDN